jgi:hypothetical protein
MVATYRKGGIYNRMRDVWAYKQEGFYLNCVRVLEGVIANRVNEVNPVFIKSQI